MLENNISISISSYKRSSSGNKSESVLSDENSFSTEANFDNENKSIQDSSEFSSSINLPIRQNILEDLSNALNVEMEIFSLLTLSDEKDVNFL